MSDWRSWFMLDVGMMITQDKNFAIIQLIVHCEDEERKAESVVELFWVGILGLDREEAVLGGWCMRVRRNTHPWLCCHLSQ